MDKIQKHFSFCTNTPSSESYRKNYIASLLPLVTLSFPTSYCRAVAPLIFPAYIRAPFPTSPRRSRDVSSGTQKWNKTQPICISHRRRSVEAHLTLNGRDIPFVNHVKYLGVVFDRIISWRMHIEAIAAKVFITFICVNPLFKSRRLSANIKLTIYKALVKQVMTLSLPRLEISRRHLSFEIIVHAKQSSMHHW